MICRRHAAWSIATFTDGLLTNFVLPFGPLLLLSHLEPGSYPQANTEGDNGIPLMAKEQEDGAGGEVILHWAVVAKLWSQVRPGGGQRCAYIGRGNYSSTLWKVQRAAAKTRADFFPHAPPTPLPRHHTLLFFRQHPAWCSAAGTDSLAFVPPVGTCFIVWGAHPVLRV